MKRTTLYATLAGALLVSLTAIGISAGLFRLLFRRTV